MDKNASQIQAMFDQLAPRYDLMNRVMTFGMDQRWRKAAVKKAQIQDNNLVLDLAAGTGDIAFEMVKRYPKANIIAGDFSIGMLAQGQTRKMGNKIKWLACDAMNLPFKDNSLDVVIFGYLLRNVEDLDQTLAEIYRVLKPGGRIVCLDTTPPPKGLLRPVIQTYMRLGLKFFAQTLSSDQSGHNYRYLCDSTFSFLSAYQLAERFKSAGFQKVAFKTYNFRIIALHWGEKEGHLDATKIVEKG